MFMVFYFTGCLVAVLTMLCVYRLMDVERHSHPSRLARATGHFDALFARGAASGDFRLPSGVSKSLRSPIKLEAFYNAAKNLADDRRLRVLLDNQEELIAQQLRTTDKTVHAFFAYALADLRLRPRREEGYGYLMFKFLDDESVYVRENALKAIYSFGDAGLVARSFAHLSAMGVWHNEKLLTDGLMTFAGDAVWLADVLMERYDDLLECYRNALIAYMGLRSIDSHDEALMEIALGEDVSCDTLCCVIRKIARVPSERNLRFLEGMLRRHEEGDEWEPAAVAASGLGRYEGNDEVRELLKSTLASHDYYVRKNSAASLVAVGIDQGDVEDVYELKDRFAADAINYAVWRDVHV